MKLPSVSTRHHGTLATLAAGLLLAAVATLVVFNVPVIDPVGADRLAVAQRHEGHEGHEGQAYDPAATPPPDNAPGWQAVTLPDNWDSTRPEKGGYTWYRLPVPDLARRPGQLAVYLPAVGMNAQVFINQASLGSIGRMTEPLSRNFYTPLMFPLPRALLHGGTQGNVLHILVGGYPQHRNGLAEVYVGTEPSLRPAWHWRGFWQNTGTLISSVLTVALGAYVLMLWSRERGNAVFGWFGLAAVVWGVRNLNLVITDFPIPNLLWSQLGVVGAVGFVGFFALFTLRYCESESAAMDRPVGQATDEAVPKIAAAPAWQTTLIWLFMLGASLALLLPDTFEATRANFRWVGLCGVVLTCWTQMKLSTLAWRLRTAEAALIAVAGVIYIALMLHDYHVTNDKQMLGQYYLRQYAALPLFIAIGSMLTQRYLTALERARHMAASLASEVKAQHDRLALNFQQLRDAERQQVQAHERERLMRDLHDGLGLHLLSALIQARSPVPDAAAMAEILQDCLDDLRVAVDSLAGDERDPATILGSLRFRMAPRVEAAGVKLEWDVEGEIPELEWLDPEKSLQLLRIVQEALSNAMRHSGASVIRIALRGTLDILGMAIIEISVSDNGSGLDTASTGRRSAGRGMENMRVRTQRLGGTLRIDSSASGTWVLLTLPVVKEALSAS